MEVVVTAGSLFCCCSRTLAMPVAMLVLSRLELQMVSHHEVQHNTALRDTDAAARFMSVAPAGLAAWLLPMNTHARNLLLHGSKQQPLSHTILCFALPEAIHLLFDGGISYGELQPLTC
uniref:Uncharacterized protein n=1 Tax=Coturnix japonica TaxID=93934 RepID=A0A8C2T622_COTJA